MEDSKKCYGGVFLNEEDLRESKRKKKTELQYFSTDGSFNYCLKESSKKFGIEIQLKEYRRRKVKIESECLEGISDDYSFINDLILKLKKLKVTPVNLKEVVHDLLNDKVVE